MKLRELEAQERERQRQHELELARLQYGAERQDAVQTELHRAPKIPSFMEEKDKIDSYLGRFERYAENAKWQRNGWAIKLSALLSGSALDVYNRMSEEDAKDYDKLKDALLRHFNYTEKGYRQRFRECKPEAGETPEQFIERLMMYLQKWVELSGLPKDYNHLRDLIVKEQFVVACPKDLAVHLEEQESQTLPDLAKCADRYLVAHGKTLAPPKQQPKHQKPPKTENQNNSDNSRGMDTSNQKGCFYCKKPGHRIAQCLKRLKDGSSTAG